jgi:competence protein ComEC
LAALVVTGAWLGARAWDEVTDPTPGGFDGWAQVMADPAPMGRGVRTVLEVEGQRFDVAAFGSAARRLDRRQAGQWVQVVGVRRADTSLRTFQRVRHVVGRFDVDRVAGWWEGLPAARAANRVRAALRTTATQVMAPVDAEVFLGLVIGDDGRQDDATVHAFRASGLSHLSAVSGQNVAYVIAGAALVLRWLRPWARWAATLLVIGWFVVLTRAEPSVLRAGAMAAVAATAHVRGVQVRPLRVVSACASVLVMVDPLLVWSVGFWLSISATLGVTLLAPWLAPRLPGPAWARLPLSVTLGAQAAVALPSVLVFGRLPLSAAWTNLLAVPVAGVVMLLGVPLALAAMAFPAAGEVILLPCTLGTRWVLTVARLGERLDPGSAVATATGWLLLATLLAVALSRPRPTP